MDGDIKKYFSDIPQELYSLFDKIQYPWEALNRFADFFSKLRFGGDTKIFDGAHIRGNVFIGKGTVIEPGAVIYGPTYIGENCQVRSHAYIRGNVVVGDGSVVGHATEIVRSILLSRVHVDHFNYIGDSILGNRVHFGAGAKVANLRFDEMDIMIDGIQTGRKKLGVILGDECQLGVNVSLGPGVLLEKGVWIPSKDQISSGFYTKTDFRKKIRLQ